MLLPALVEGWQANVLTALPGNTSVFLHCCRLISSAMPFNLHGAEFRLSVHPCAPELALL